MLCRYLSDALKLMGRLTSAVTTESALWSVYADLTALPAAGAGPFKPRQLRQRAAACAAQKTGWEKGPSINDVCGKFTIVYFPALICTE